MGNHTPVRDGGWPEGSPFSSTEAGQLQSRVLKSPNADDGSTHNGTLTLGGVETQHIQRKRRAITTAGTAGPHNVTAAVQADPANEHSITVSTFAGDQTLNITIDGPRVGDQGVILVRKLNGPDRALTLDFITGGNVDLILCSAADKLVGNNEPAGAVTKFRWDCVADPNLGNVVIIRNEGTFSGTVRRRPATSLDGLFDPRYDRNDFPPGATTDGHFSGGTEGFIRETVSFSGVTGEQTFEFSKSPSSPIFIFESATIELTSDVAQSGTPDPMEVAIDFQRVLGSSPSWMTVCRGLLPASRFSGASYDKDVLLSAWGMSEYDPVAGVDGSSRDIVVSPYRAWDGRIFLEAVAASDVFKPVQGILHGLRDDDRVCFFAASGGALPAGLTAGTVYYVVNAGTGNFKVSTTSGGAAVDITTAGTYPFYAAIQANGLSIGKRGIYASGLSWRSGGGRFRLRAKTIDNLTAWGVTTTNTWSLTARVSLQYRTVR